MTEPTAKIILDSINMRGDRLTTVEVTLHRFVLAELNTHRSHSRNSASSRAIPVAKQLARVNDDPAIPLVWSTEQSGMQGGEPLRPSDAIRAEMIWLEARDAAIDHAEALVAMGVHKSITNRLLEPFMWHTVIASATDAGWANFFNQRCSPLAQPEIRVAAEAIEEAYNASEPKRLAYGAWHLPFIQDEEYIKYPVETLRKISTARCARVSYLTHDGTKSLEGDLNLYERLVTADPAHASPLEHVATPSDRPDPPGNFVGWAQLRHRVIS